MYLFKFLHERKALPIGALRNKSDYSLNDVKTSGSYLYRSILYVTHKILGIIYALLNANIDTSISLKLLFQ